MGGSSGGHLVSLLGMLDGKGDTKDPSPVNRTSAKVQVVVARAAPTDLTLSSSSRNRDADEVVSYDNSEVMRDALDRAGVPADLLRIPGGGHGPTFPGATNPPDFVHAMVEWFDRYLPGH